MSKSTKKLMQTSERKTHEDKAPIQNHETALPAITQDEESNINPASVLEWMKSCGVSDPDLVVMLSTQLLTSNTNSKGDLELFHDGILAMHKGIGPKDTTESLLAAQMTVSHNMAMEFSRQAMQPRQGLEAVDAHINRVAKLMRLFTVQAETLRRYRTGGQQTIQVQHVTVNDGGQAVVGNIQGGSSGS